MNGIAHEFLFKHGLSHLHVPLAQRPLSETSAISSARTATLEQFKKKIALVTPFVTKLFILLFSVR
jgi:hypothetical protein